MTFQSIERKTRLQNALRALAEGQALVDQNNADLSVLVEAGHCIRAALAMSCELREKVAQSRRDVILARDRIRFGLDEACVEVASLSELSNPVELNRNREGSALFETREVDG